MYTDKSTKLLLTISISLYCIAGFFSWLDRNVGGLPIRFSALSFLMMCSLCIVFMIYTRRDFPYPRQRGFILAAVGFLLAWEILETMVWVLFPAPTAVSRTLWYLYYVPTTMMPNCLFMAILHTGDNYYRSASRKWNLTFLISIGLSIAVLCNDRHLLAFRFPAEPTGPYGEYTYGPLYFVTMGWVFLLLFASEVRAIRASSIRHIRDRAKWVIIPLLLAVLYFLWWITGRKILPHLDDAFGVTEVWGALLLFSIEAAIQSRLLRMNSNSHELFEASTIPAQIEDAGKIYFHTANPIAVSKEQKRRARQEGELYIDNDHRLHTQALSGGRVYWVEDLSQVNRVTRQVAETQEKLEQENDLIAAENDMIARQARAEEQNRLYTLLAQRTESQQNQIEQILTSTNAQAPDVKEKLARACIYKAFVKRFSNLMLLQQESETLRLFELQSSLRESLDYISLNGVRTHLAVNGNGLVQAEVLILLYSLFQEVVERTIDDLQELSVFVGPSTNAQRKSTENGRTTSGREQEGRLKDRLKDPVEDRLDMIMTLQGSAEPLENLPYRLQEEIFRYEGLLVVRKGASATSSAKAEPTEIRVEGILGGVRP